MEWYNIAAPFTMAIPGLSPFFGSGAHKDDNANPNKSGPYNEQLSGDSMTRAMLDTQNRMANQAASTTSAGNTTFASGVGAMAPVLQQLSALVHGNAGDVNQAMQPEVNRIRDSFAAARNMISGQARGGGKAGVLAEQSGQQARAIGDQAAQARQGATGALGQMASTLAGIGQGEQELGSRDQQNVMSAILGRRGQNMGPGSFASGFGQVAQALQALI